jgi:hypothetical protein
MPSQLSATFVAWRWIIAVGALMVGTSMLRDAGGDMRVALMFLLLAAGMMGLEVALRRARKTLVVDDATVRVWRRGDYLGSAPLSAVRYRDRSTRVRALVKAQLVSFVCFFVFGALVYTSGERPLSAVLLGAGVIFSAAAFWEFRTAWEILLPALRASDAAIEIRTPADTAAIVVPRPSAQTVVLLRRRDVEGLLREKKGSGSFAEASGK